MATTMADSSLESVVYDEISQTRQLSETPDEPCEPQSRLKRRKKLLQSLQRISSSPSIARLTRSSSSSHAYRGTGQASMSCISLSSSSYNSYGLGTAYSSRHTNGYATAPTSVPSTPALEVPPGSRVRFVPGTDIIRVKIPSTVPVPSDLKQTSRPTTASGGASTIKQDYFSRPTTQSKPKPLVRKLDFWGEMPAEIKMQILGLLEPKEIVRCSPVSKSWHAMCFDGQLWASMDTAEFYSDIPAIALVKIVTRAGPFVRDLNLRGCVQLRDNWRSSGLPEVCTNLENLSLEGCAIDRNSIHSFLRNNHRLVHINLTGLIVSNSAMRVIAQSCPRLELLNISWCKMIDQKGILDVIECCPKLSDLRASEVRGFGEIELMNEIFKRNTLERLILVNCDGLTDESLQALVEGVDNEVDILTGRAIVPSRVLRHLDISRCRNITDVGIRALVDHVPLLEGLQVGRCRSLTDFSLTLLLPTLPNLTHLDLEELDRLTNATLQELAISPSCNVLQHLSISYCELLGDVGMLPVIKACPNLRSLDLDNTRISDLVLAEAAAMVRQRCAAASFPSFSAHNPALLSRPRAITWDGGSAPGSNSISTGPAKPKIGLRMVVYDCQNVTWTGIREVLSRNAEIRRPMAPSFLLPSFAPPTTAMSQAQAHAASVHPALTNDEEAVRATTTKTLQTQQYRATTAPSHPHQIISLKVFYGYQPTVTEHTRRVLRGDLASASRLERKWAEYMIASEEAGAAMGVGTGNGLGRFGVANGIGNATAGLGMLGHRRRRRRVREAQMMHADEEEGGVGGAGGVGRRRRARSNGGCAMM